jgi:hypothetical protein
MASGLSEFRAVAHLEASQVDGSARQHEAHAGTGEDAASAYQQSALSRARLDALGYYDRVWKSISGFVVVFWGFSAFGGGPWTRFWRRGCPPV